MSSALTDARDALHVMLLAADLTRAATGGAMPLEKERRHRLPQAGNYPMPCAWVGLPSVSRTGGDDVQVEMPVVLAFDGSDDVQLTALDENGAVIWDAIGVVDLGAGSARAQSATVQRLGPEGSATFGLVVSVRIPLVTASLCDSGHLTHF